MGEGALWLRQRADEGCVTQMSDRSVSAPIAHLTPYAERRSQRPLNRPFAKRRATFSHKGRRFRVTAANKSIPALKTSLTLDLTALHTRVRVATGVFTGRAGGAATARFGRAGPAAFGRVRPSATTSAPPDVAGLYRRSMFGRAAPPPEPLVFELRREDRGSARRELGTNRVTVASLAARVSAPTRRADESKA